MSNKIFPKEWKETHPYKKSDPSDSYYTKIANRVLEALVSSKLDNLLDQDKTRRVALALTSWFEDVMSDLGIWKAFTAECKRRYGTYLPFYDTTEDNYFHDEINLVDVQFLLWHYLQQDRMSRALINPENIGLQLTAIAVYEIFDREYEEAPVNKTLSYFFANLDVSAKSFYPLRNTMEWFCYACYLNIYNLDKQIARTMDFFEDQDMEERDENFIDMMTYNLRVDYLLSARNILALTSYQWLSMIVRDSEKKELLNNICYKSNVGILVDRADSEYVYAREVGAKDETLKITIESIDPKNVKQYLGKIVLTSLLYFDGVWWVSGTVMQVDVSELEDRIAEDQKKEKMIKDTNDLFRKKTKGKQFLFFNNTDEYGKFMRKTLGIKVDTATLLPADVEGDDVFLCENPKQGIYTQFDICSSLKHPDNPMYDREEAKKYAHTVLLDIEIPYYMATLMIDEGLLSDAQMTSMKGEEYGHKLMQDNIHFLNDYYRERCRDLDYVE